MPETRNESRVGERDTLLGNITYKQAVRDIVSMALPMAASFTFSFAVALLGPMATQFKTKDASGESLNSAAASLITTLLNPLALITSSAVLAVAAIASEASGKGLNSDSLTREQKTAYAFRSGFLWSSAMSVVGFFILYFSKDIFVALGQDSDVAEKAQEFLRPYSAFMPFLLFRMLFEQIMFVRNQAKRAMWMALGSFVIGAGLAWYLAITKSMGFQGAAIGFLVDAVFVCVLFGVNLLWDDAYSDIPFFGLPKWSEIKTFLHRGSSFFIPVISEQAAFFALNIIIGHLGPIQLAAQNFALQMMFVSILVQISVANTSAIKMNQAVGEGNCSNASQFANAGMLANAVGNFGVSVAWMGFMYWLAKGHESYEYVKYLLPVALGVQLLETAHYTATTQLRFRGKVLKPVLISSGSRLLGVLSAFLFQKMDTKVYGVMSGYGLALFIGFAGVLYPYWSSRVTEEAFRSGAHSPSPIPAV